MKPPTNCRRCQYLSRDINDSRREWCLHPAVREPDYGTNAGKRFLGMCWDKRERLRPPDWCPLKAKS